MSIAGHSSLPPGFKSYSEHEQYAWSPAGKVFSVQEELFRNGDSLKETETHQEQQHREENPRRSRNSRKAVPGEQGPDQRRLTASKAPSGICRGSSKQGYPMDCMHCAELRQRSLAWPSCCSSHPRVQDFGEMEITERLRTRLLLTGLLPALWARLRHEENGERSGLRVLRTLQKSLPWPDRKGMILSPSRASMKQQLWHCCCSTALQDNRGFPLRVWCSSATKT